MLKQFILAGAVAATLTSPALAQPRYYQVPMYYQNYTLNSPHDVVFTNLGNGSTVGRNFVVEGYTSPGNVVDVTVSSQFFGQHNNTVQADGAGRFGSNVDTTIVPLGGQVTVTMRARGGPARSITVVRTQ